MIPFKEELGDQFCFYLGCGYQGFREKNIMSGFSSIWFVC